MYALGLHYYEPYYANCIILLHSFKIQIQQDDKRLVVVISVTIINRSRNTNIV